MRPTLLFVLLFATAGSAAAQQDDLPFKLPGSGGKAKSFFDLADIKSEIVPATAKPGDTVTFKLTISPKPGAWTYPTNPPGMQDSTIRIKLPDQHPALAFE